MVDEDEVKFFMSFYPKLTREEICDIIRSVELEYFENNNEGV